MWDLLAATQRAILAAQNRSKLNENGVFNLLNQIEALMLIIRLVLIWEQKSIFKSSSDLHTISLIWVMHTESEGIKTLK